MFMTALNGVDLKQDEAGNYTFAFNGGDSRTLLAGVYDEYIFFTMNGVNFYGTEINNVLRSLKDK